MTVSIEEKRFAKSAAKPADLLKVLGELAVSAAQRAFEEESFDGRQWPEAYANMPQPRVRLANLVGSLLEGAKPPDRVLSGRPAGTYSGELKKSIAKRIIQETPNGGVVEVGSWEEYAGRFQRGGRSTQTITPSVREGLKKWLDKLDPKAAKERKRGRTLRGQDRKLADEHAGATAKRRATIERRRAAIAEERSAIRERVKGSASNAIRARVGFLFSVDQLATNSVPRPFVGETKQLREDLKSEVERFFARGG